MAEFRLHFAVPDSFTADEAKAGFYWTSSSATSTITTTLGPSVGRYGPNLGALGPVNDRNIDLVRIATAVFCADRSTPRSAGGSDWNRRPIRLTVPVLDPPAWAQRAGELKAVVDLLTGDDWTFDFVHEPAPAEEVAMPTSSPARVVLLSGGADSAAGALVSRSQLADGESHTLVSHFSSTLITITQRDVARQLEELVPGPAQDHLSFHCARRSKQLDKKNYRDETTSRSRSLLFLALGLAVASVHSVPLWIPENGFASLNPPLGRERLGSISTRTTHPAFLLQLEELMVAIGGHGTIVNPFQWDTKGEMFQQVARLVGEDKASAFLSSTHSCSHTDQRNLGVPYGVGCGVCFGCVVRRASFKAAQLDDASQYVGAGGDAKIQHWLDGKSIEGAAERFSRRGIKPSEVVAMSLPESADLDLAIDLCQRGLAELSGLYS